MDNKICFKMKNYSLSIYRISINKRLNKDEKLYLSDYDNGKDLLNQLREYFCSLKVETFTDDLSAIIKDEEERKISRILKRQDGSFELYASESSRYISGLIESGEFGTEENIINSNTGELKYRKSSVDAQMIPFFFMFYIPEHSHFGYLIIERIGNFGVFSTLVKSIQKFIGPNLDDNVVLKIEPFFIQEVLDRNLNVVSEAKKVILKCVRMKDLGLSLITENLVDDDDTQTDLVYRASRNSSIPIRKWLDKLNSSKNKQGIYTFKDVEYADVAFELKIGGKVKTVSIARINSLGTNIEVTDSVQIASNGYPTYQSLLTEAQNLLSYIKDEKE